MSVSRWRRLPASKILPKFANFVFQDRIFFLELFDHVVLLENCARETLQSNVSTGCRNVAGYVSFCLPRNRRVKTAAMEIIAHR
jgi:hypothetical protein